MNLNLTSCQSCLTIADQAILITACICHDLDHPGTTNSYQVNAGTELAARFKTSPLENHHLEVSLRSVFRQQSQVLCYLR